MGAEVEWNPSESPYGDPPPLDRGGVIGAEVILKESGRGNNKKDTPRGACLFYVSIKIR